MRAIPVTAYGSPDLLVVRDVLDVAAPGEHDLVVEVAAASVNAADCYAVRGSPFPIRLTLGLLRPKIAALGVDVAGRVCAIGSKVTELSVGDEVIADLSGVGLGAFAEQVRAPALVWVKKPTCLSLQQAAAVPMAGMTALEGLRDVAKVQAGERVLVVGAAGGVGSFAVQIARALGAEVTAVCGASKASRISSLGVAEILEASRLDELLARGSLDDRFEVVFDCAAYRSPFAFGRSLRRAGRFVCVGGAMSRLLQTAFLGPLVGLATRRRYFMFMQRPRAALLAEVVALIEKGEVRPLIDRTFAFDEVAEAVRHLEDRRVCGKILLAIRD
jgi:NADPH:quinone reductase-like Zn-dependent oxidoreductase